MKNRFYNKVIIVILAIITFTSCKDLFDVKDIKTNPNASPDVSLNTLLTGTLVGLGTIHEDTDVRISLLWSGQLAGESRQHLAFGNYQVSASTFSWANLYSVVTNARIIQGKALPLKNKVALGIAQVVEALAMERIVDLWGDAPYSQAIDGDKYPTPIYDKQVDVYASLIALLNTAYANLSSLEGSVSADREFFFQGNATKWSKVAKTLQARLYLHLGDYQNAIASATLGISSASGDALMPHGNSQTIDLNMNYDFFSNTRPGDTGFDPPAFMPDFMKSPPNKISDYVRNSKTNETALYNHFFQIGAISESGLDPNINDGMFTADAPQPLVTFYENQFILAESYARLSSPNIQASVDALNSIRQQLRTGYVNGKIINPSYQALGLLYDDYILADFNSGGIANPASTGRTQQTALLYEIAVEKYFLLLAQYEAFNEVRRLAKAVPVVQLGIVPTIGNQLPARFIYPQNQINTNPNVPKNGTGGVNDIFQKLEIFK